VFCVGGIVFGQVSMFVLCGGDAVIEEQIVIFAQSLKRPWDVLSPCYFALSAGSFWSNMMVLSSVLCDMGLGVKAGAARVEVGALETDSMANAFLVVVKTGGVILCLYLAILPILIHPSLSSFLSISSIPEHRHLLSKFSIFAYLFISTVNEWWGLKVTLSSLQMDLNLYPFFVPHAFVWVDAMGLPALDFCAMGACVLCWRLIVVLLCFFLLFAACLGSFVLLAVASVWFAFIL
jgi:hypothetical protein